MLSGKCDLVVKLHDTAKSYRAGDTVTGHVIVHVNKSCECNGLRVVHEWRTHGRGNRDSKTLSKDVIFKGTWQPGTYEYPFSFVIGRSTPTTYHGEIVNVDHYITARADIPWALDPKAEADFIVVPAGKVDFNVDVERTKSHSVVEGLAACGLITVVYAFIFVIFGDVTWDDFSAHTLVEDNPLLIGVGVLSFFGGIYSLYKYWRLSLLGDVTVRMKKSMRQTGTINIEVALEPKVAMDLKSVSASLISRESATSGSGTNESTEHNDVKRSHIDFELSNPQLAAGTEFVGSGKLVVADSITPTFSSDNNSVRWEVELLINTNKIKNFSMRETIQTHVSNT